MTFRRLAAALFLGAIALTAAAEEWRHYGGDLAGTRFVRDSRISPDNIDSLQVAWQFRTGDATDGSRYSGRRSTFKATPILIDGKLLFSTGFNRVFAIDAASGDELWVFDPEVDFSITYSEMFTSRGISAWQRERAGEKTCAARVFLGTLDARLIAIDANTGKRCGRRPCIRTTSFSGTTRRSTSRSASRYSKVSAAMVFSRLRASRVHCCSRATAAARTGAAWPRTRGKALQSWP